MTDNGRCRILLHIAEPAPGPCSSPSDNRLSLAACFLDVLPDTTLPFTADEIIIVLAEMKCKERI